VKLNDSRQIIAFLSTGQEGISNGCASKSLPITVLPAPFLLQRVKRLELLAWAKSPPLSWNH